MARKDLLSRRGGRIDPMKVRQGPFDSEDRIDQAIAESFPASDPPSWNAGVDRKAPPEAKKRRRPE